MKTIVYACFTTLGKTYANNKLKNSIDLESTNFKWIYKDNLSVEALKGSKNRELNPNWPANYIEEILKNLGKFEYIFISLNVPEIFEILEQNNVEYKIVLPSGDMKSTILNRLMERKNSIDFINSIEEKFDEILEYYKNYENVIYLNKHQYLLDYIINH